jgi:hypothetical protein
MSYDRVHEKIEVVADFKPGRVDIKSFTWKDKTYVVKEVNLTSKAYKGREIVWVFNVSTETAAFKLRFDTDLLTWFLEELTWEEKPE